MLPFSFTQAVPEAVVKRWAEKFEAQAGGPLWFDWADFRDDAGRALLAELEQMAVRLNMRAHRIERSPDSGGGTAIICSFESETEMVVFKVGASAVW